MILPNVKGSLIMVSDFIDEHIVFLRLTPEELIPELAIQIFQSKPPGSCLNMVQLGKRWNKLFRSINPTESIYLSGSGNIPIPVALVNPKRACVRMVHVVSVL